MVTNIHTWHEREMEVEKREANKHRMVSGGEGGGELSQESTHTLICFFLDFL